MSFSIESVANDSAVDASRGSRGRIRGALTFATAAAAHAVGVGLLDSMAGRNGPRAVSADAHGLTPVEVLCLDCSGITEADSAGLAVLLDWRREAIARGFALRYDQLPLPLVQLARISGVESLLDAQ